MTTVAPLQALDAYEMWRIRRVSLRTWEGEKSTLLNLCDWLTYLDLAVDRVTPEVLEEWWWAQELADSTRHTRVSQVRSFFSFVVHVKRWIADDPSVYLMAPRPMVEPRRQLDAAEILAALDAARCPQHRIVLALAANLALRSSEIKRLRVADWWGHQIRVRVEKTKEVDDMPVTSDLAGELRRWMDHYRRAYPGLRRSHPLVPSQYVSNINNRIHYRPDRGSIGDPEDVVHAALATLGWESSKGEGIHTIRRSVARLFYDAATDEDGGRDDALLATMRLLHHAKPTTTLRYIGVDRQTEARNAILTNKPFLTRLAAGVTPLAQAQ